MFSKSKGDKSIFEKRKEGLSRSEFRSELKKVNYNSVHLNEEERLALEKEMGRAKYSEHIDVKDIDEHIKKLKKEEYTKPTEKERLDARHKRILLETLRKKTI